ncbi:hypothetical protein CEP54_004022 [Fusarium duplospermum]|uniref:Uncharacterized protein n=1 Tax=Fusarium duplospermum TaxID=1325734 RepID=A0A428QKT0_9HYPO|nr:hypothetical protein CEP54_004022 [Fusarium duplospermum]
MSVSSSQLGQSPNDKDTLLPGRWVDPTKLEKLLNHLFEDQYAVSMRNNSYVVWASRRLGDDEKEKCLRPAFTRLL